MMPILESIVHKGMSVADFKVQLIAEAYKQGIDQKLTADRWVWSMRGGSDMCAAAIQVLSIYPGFDFVRKLGRAQEQCT